MNTALELTNTLDEVTRELAAAAPSPEKVPPVPVLDAGEWLETVVAAPLPIIEGLIAPRLKMAIIGSAKSRKTWLALQAALCTAAGRDFLAWRVPKPRRVLVIQMEVPDWSFHFRLTQVAAAIGIRPEDLGGRLRILNCRGVSILLQYETEGRRKHAEFVPWLIDLIIRERIELLIIDPLYKAVEQGDENTTQDLKPVLRAMDALAEDTNAAVVYVHHNPKGNANERDIVDRGAGSSTMARDYDACITLNRHESKGLQVIESIARNYPETPPFSVAWSGFRFSQLDVEPVLWRAGKSRAIPEKAEPPRPAGRPSKSDNMPALADAAVSLLRGRPLPLNVFDAKFKDTQDVGRNIRQQAVRYACEAGLLRRHRVIVDGSRYELIGLPDEVRREAARLAQPDLPAPPAPTAGVAQTQGTHAGKALESAPSGSAAAGG